jgi:hypothetical protein
MVLRDFRSFFVGRQVSTQNCGSPYKKTVVG